MKVYICIGQLNKNQASTWLIALDNKECNGIYEEIS